MPLDVAALARGGSIMVLAPHPDDEVLGCGGLIAAALARGLPVHVVILTDGAASHPGADRARLRDLRRRETITAIERLGGTGAMLTFLDFADGALGADPGMRPGAVDRVAAVIDDHAVGTLVAPWHADPHPDHIAAAWIAAAAGRAAVRAPRRVDYAVWAWVRPPATPLPVQGLALDARGSIRRRRFALLAHRSQLGQVSGLGPGFILPQSLRVLVERATEHYFTPEA